MDIKKLINDLRNGIEKDYFDTANSSFFPNQIFDRIDDFINSDSISDLEKAVYLLLNQFPNDKKDYIIIPNEKILIPDIYDLSTPGIEYEIDFALYGGTIENPVKVAIECDGIRSHAQRHSNKDRRKDVNLQAAGWIVMRFGSKEIHTELEKAQNEEFYICDFITSIDNVIKEQTKLITWRSYAQNEFRSKLTGFKWGWLTCNKCSQQQIGILNIKKHVCRHCGEKFIRKIDESEKIKYDHKGLLYFEE